MIKLCIFDLDGTVLDTLPTIAYYGNKTLEEFGIPARPVDEFRYFAGTGIKNLIRKMLAAAGYFDDETFEKVLRVYDNAYNADASYKTEIFEGLKETLDGLKSRGILFAVATNKPQSAAIPVLTHFYGENYFEIISGQEGTRPLKPDPRTVFDILGKLNIKKEEALYFGDTSTDMQTGKNAGLFTVGVLWGFRNEKELRESGADIIIKKPDEITKLVFGEANND